MNTRLTIARLRGDSALPTWAGVSSEFLAIVRTPTELSIVAAAGVVPSTVQQAGPYRALRLAGPIPLTETGILVGMARHLAKARVPIFPIASYDTDYVLVPDDRAADAVTVLQRAGFTVVDELGHDCEGS